MAEFVATSDWHIGARMGSAGRAATRFREVKFETAERIVRLANDEGAGALLLLGDTFDGDGVGAADVERTVRILAEARGPVLVLPGNHDWWHAGGVLRAFARAAESTENVRVLHEPQTPLTVDGLPGVTFYPCPLLKHAGVADPTRWIPPRRAEDGVRVGLIHGALDRADWGGRVPERVAEERDLDLAVLGDWHKPVDGPDGRTFYAGSPEPGGFDEEHVGQVLLVTVEGGSCEVRRTEVGRLAWRRIEQTLESAEVGGIGPGALEDLLAGIGTEKEDTALRLRLSGKLTLEEMDALDGMLADLAEVPWAECDVRSEVELLGEPDLDTFDEGSMRAVAERIWEGDADPAVKRRSLAILAAKVEETR